MLIKPHLYSPPPLSLSLSLSHTHTHTLAHTNRRIGRLVGLPSVHRDCASYFGFAEQKAGRGLYCIFPMCFVFRLKSGLKRKSPAVDTRAEVSALPAGWDAEPHSLTSSGKNRPDVETSGSILCVFRRRPPQRSSGRASVSQRGIIHGGFIHRHLALTSPGSWAFFLNQNFFAKNLRKRS